MTVASLAVVVSFATFAIAVTAARLSWRPVQRAAVALARHGRCGADDLLLLRITPVVMALTLLLFLVVPAFLRFEPRGRHETSGVPLLLAAGAGAALLGSAIRRAARDLAATRALIRAWLARSTPLARPGLPLPAFILETREPHVAVVGFVRRRLFVSDRVIAACSARELDAILQHEAGHFRAADNLKRLLVRACPDALARSREDRALERAWSAAAEEGADAFALRRGVEPVDLASALIAVARLGAPPRLAGIASGFHEGDDVERRVRRALSGLDPVPTPRWLRLLRAGLLTLPCFTFVAAASPGALAAVYDVVERAVGFLR